MSKHFYTWFTCCLFALLTVLPVSADEYTVNAAATGTNSNLPFYGLYADTQGQHSQSMYLPDDLGDVVAGSTITALTFYSSTTTQDYGAAVYAVSLLETSDANLSSAFVATSGATTVYSGSLTIANGEMAIVFSTPYVYGGGNLVVDFTCTTNGTYHGTSFYCRDIAGMGRYNNGSGTGSALAYQPKMKIEYTAGSVTCAKPTDLVLDTLSITGTSASFSWTPSEENETSWTLQVKNGTETLVDDVTVNTPSYTLTNLVPGTKYSIFVKVTHTCSADDAASLSKSLSFTTACATITSFPWIERFEDDASGDLDKPCWTNAHVDVQGTTYQNYVFKVYTTATGGNSTHMLQYPYMSTGNSARLILPEMNIPAANTYEFVIRAYRPSVTTESYLKEGMFVVVGTDTLAFIPRGYQSMQGTKETNALNVVPAEEAAGWYEYRFTIPNAGVQNIHLFGRSCGGSAMYMDDLRVRRIPTCWPTKNAWVEDITTNSAKLVWNEASTPGDYHVVVKYGTTVIADQVVSDTSLVVTGLTPATTYSGVEVSITTVCSATDSSEPFEGVGSFMTNCELIEFTEEELTFDFEDLATGKIHTFPCWDTLQVESTTSTSYYWYVTTTAHTGSRSVYASSMTSSVKKMALIFPGVDLPEGYEISAWVKEGSHYDADTLWFYMNNQPSLNGATLVGTVYDMSTSWSEFRKPLTGQEGPTYIIVVSHSYGSLYLDDVTLRPAPNCMPVPAAEFALLEDNSIKLTWTPGAQETKWKVTLEDVEGYIQGDDYENIIVEDTPELLLEDLLEANVKDTLHVSIVAVCGEGNESEEVYTNSFAFHTPAEPAAVPYENDFSNEEENTAWININVAVNAWYTGEAAHEEAGNGALYVSNDGGVTNAYTVSGTQFAWAYRALNFEEAGDYELSFDWIGKGESSYDGMIVIIVPANVIPEAASSASCKVGELTSFSKSTTIAAAAEKGYILLENPNRTDSYKALFNNFTEWQIGQKFNISIATPGVYNLCFGWVQDSGGGSQPAAAVDNLSIAKKACSATPEPSILSIGTDSVVIGWESKHDTYAYILKEGTTIKAENAAFEGNTIAIGGLTAATEYSYELTLFGICGEANSDTLVVELPFVTNCLAAQLPWSDDFESYTSTVTSSSAPTTYPNDRMPLCWTFLNRSQTSSTYPQIFLTAYSAYAVSGNCLFFKSSSATPAYAILPLVDGDLSTQQIVFTYRNEGVSEYNGTLHVGYMTGISEDTYVDLYECAQTTTKTEVEVGLSTIPAGARVAFKYVGGTNNNYYMAIDNISLQPLPTCFPTTEAVVDTVTTNSMTLLWNTPKVEGTYHVLLKKDTTVLADEVLSDTMLVVSGLVPGTVYKDCDLKITTICSEADTSKVFSKKISFTTACEVVSVLPWSQGFEDYAGTTYNVEGEVPACWDAYSAPATVVKPHVVKSGSFAYIHSGTKSLAFYGNGANYVVLPEFTAALNTLQISFWRRMESASNGALEIGYITAADENLNTFVRIDSLTNSTSYTIYEKFLDDVPAEAAHLVLKWSASTQYACCVDDINVELTPTCRKPLSLTVDTFTYNSVSLSWEVAHNEPQFQIAVLPADSALTWEGAQIVSGTSATINGLTPETPYKVTFRAYCSAEDQSEVRTAIFTTYPSCYVPTNLKVKGIGTTTATVEWVDAHEAGAYTVAYGLADSFNLAKAETYSTIEVTDTFAVLNTLLPAMSYKVAVRANCGAELNDSKYTSAVLFTTNCEAITALPWSEDFENLPKGSSYAAAPLCWALAAANDGAYPYIYVNTSSGYVHSGSQSLYFQSSSSRSGFAILPEFAEGVLDGAEILFFYKHENATSSGVPTVGYITDITDTATFVAIEVLTRSTTWQEAEIALPTLPAGARLAIRYGKQSQNYFMGIDDIRIRRIPTCFAPTSVSAEEVTKNEAKLVWIDRNHEAGSYSVTVKNGETVIGEANRLVENDTTLVLTGLNSATAYTLSVAITKICSETDQSEEFTGSVSFTTECDYISTLPWVENFESFAAGATPICWDNTEGTTTTAAYRFSTYSDAGNMCMRFNSYSNSAGNTNFIKSPEIILPAIVAESDTAILGFDWKDPAGGDFAAYVLSNAGVIDTLVEGLNDQDDWAHLEYSLGAFAGDTVRIVFKGISNWGSNDAYIYVDNVSINFKTCVGPSDIVRGVVTENSASFSWNGGEAASWKVIATVNGVAREEVTVDAPNYVLDQLVGNKAYTVVLRVVGVCDGGLETLPATATLNFRTAMPSDVIEPIQAQATFTVDLSADAEQGKWIIDGEGSNQFIFGTISDVPALFISNATTWYYNVSSASVSMASRMFSIPDDSTSVRVQFAWQALGENSDYGAYDYGRAFVIPEDVNLSISGTTPKMNNVTIGTSTIAGDSIVNLRSNNSVVLVDVESWQNVDQTFMLAKAGVYRLLFVWQNDGMMGEQYPLGLKNISISNLKENGQGEGLNHIEGEAVQVEKVLHNGQVYIIRDGVVYSIIGTTVR